MERVTMAMIAAQADVSKNTVSLALRHDPQIPAATRRRIVRIAKKLGYQKNPVVAQLMTELRKTHPAGYQRTIALLNANQDAQAFTRHPTIPNYVEGCRRRAAFHGYRCDDFWLHDPALNGERFDRILLSRGIRGVIVVGLMKENRLPERFASTWETQTCVVTGVRTRQPTLPFCCVDHHALVLEAVDQALKLGYRRPALVVDEYIDRLVGGRFSAGMWIGQQALPARARLPGFYQVEKAREQPELFAQWLHRHRPDALFTLNTVVKEWIEALGLRVPRDLGLIQLERRRGSENWAGMDQHNDLTGEAAVDMLVGMLHNNEIGRPAYPRATLISGSWSPGATVRQQG
jgi:LacI family transcriptional regulator